MSYRSREDMRKRLSQAGVCMACLVFIISFSTNANIATTVKASESSVNVEEKKLPVGWNSDGSNTYYLDANGDMIVGLQNIDSNIYLFNDDGSMYRGWITLSGRTFYFDENGIMQRNKCFIDGKEYQFSSTGDFVTGWYIKDGRKYYKDEYGYDQTGVISVGDNLYYISEIGLCTGIVYIDGQKYFTDETGAFYTGERVVNGKQIHFTDDGKYIFGWCPVDDTFIYMDEAGNMLTGAQTIDGVNYLFDESGRLYVNTVVGMYSADASGAVTRMPVTVENLDAALDEILATTGTDITAIGQYVQKSHKYKYTDKMATREEMAVYAINNKRISCYYYEALCGLLLERAGYEVITVHGKGFVYADHYWSLVKTTRNGVEGYYHVDSLKGQYVKTDAEMVAAGFKWTHSDYPATP